MSKTKQLLVRSRDRISGSSSNFRVELPNHLQEVRGISLLSVSIPNTIFNVTSLNNTFVFNEGAADLVVTLPDGSYNINTLISALTIAMDTAGTQAYVISYSSETMRLTFNAAAPFIIKTGLNSLNYILGFSEENDTASLISHTAINVIRLDYPSYLFIEVSDLQSDFTRSSQANAFGTFILPIKVNSQSLEIYSRNSDYNQNICYQSQNLTGLSIKIKKDNGQLVNMNGGDWCILLAVIYE